MQSERSACSCAHDAPPLVGQAGSPVVGRAAVREVMRERSQRREPMAEAPRFYSVSECARMFGMSDMTLYRAIQAGEFPAVKIRGRYIVPARAVEEMVEAAIGGNTLVDAADWVAPGGAA